MRTRFGAPVIAVGLLVGMCGSAWAQNPLYPADFGYSVTYQEAYGEPGYSVAHPGYTAQGYILDTDHAAPPPPYGMAPEPISITYSAMPPVGYYPPPYPAGYALQAYGHGAYH